VFLGACCFRLMGGVHVPDASLLRWTSRGCRATGTADSCCPAKNASGRDSSARSRLVQAPTDSRLSRCRSLMATRAEPRGRWTGQDCAVDPLVRKGLEPRRLASGAVVGVVIGVISALLVGSEGHKSVYYVGIALAIALTAPWILSVLYLRTERGRAAREEYLTRPKQSHGRNGEQPDWPR
jgi:hypothetical protein